MLARAVVAPRSPLLVAAVVMSLGFLFSFADPAAGAQRQASVSIFDDDAALAMFPGLTMAPGHEYAQCLLVGAEPGTAQDTVQFGASGVIGDLAEHLQLDVEVGTGGQFGDCSGFAGSSIFTGSLADLAAAGQGYGVATGWSPAESAASAFRITVSLDPGMNQQGLQAEGAFVWRLVGTPPAPPASLEPTDGLPEPSTDPLPEPSPEPIGEPSPSVGLGPSVSASPSLAPPASPTSTAVAGSGATPPTGALPVEAEPDISIGKSLARLAELLDRAQRAAVAVVVEPQYPITAILVALGFLLVQNQIDRRDPKLAAVARQRDNEADFPDRFGVGKGR
jgi:hypothetical protein